MPGSLAKFSISFISFVLAPSKTGVAIGIPFERFYVQYPLSLVFSRYQEDLEFFHSKGLSVEVYGVFAQGVLVGNFDCRTLPSDMCTDKHHCSDVYARQVYFDLKSKFSDTSGISRFLISEMLGRHYVDRVIVGASSFDQLNAFVGDEN